MCRQEHSYSMNEVFSYTGYSKQAFHQKMNRQLRQREQEILLLPLIEELRNEHPGVAARQLYWILKPAGIGRDKFEQLCFENGYKLNRPRAYKRTTDSTGVIRFPNLLAGRELKGINQAWSSDITYYEIGNTVYYLTFILDLYSRKIKGYSVSRRLLTEHTTIPALQMALTNSQPAEGLIFHSDGGGQYYSKAFLELTKRHHIHNSMCDIVYENAHAERINGTIKNQYLKGYKPDSFSSLEKQTARAVYNYNNVRPHSSLKRATPNWYDKPAGGTLLPKNVFCDSRNIAQHYQKTQSLSSRIENNKQVQKRSTFFRH
ncbi:IS3 family transposase [Microcoleus sp. AT8-B6]|uniref:IS3 family transposase n=1 Tax=Microcoleus sp. AT8-B6 TaxID=2818622 RepID=UPI002FD4ED4C